MHHLTRLTTTLAAAGALMKIPTGCMFTHIIRGSGRNITYQNAGVDCAFVAALSSGFCNWRIDFTYADTDNRTYRTASARSTRCGATLHRSCVVMARRARISSSTECAA
ncbi:hypothetical protein [Streptomyces sp. HUAS 14-6]|uniref:Secreted protein n=1 Tax=Streptomyces albidocamelliae TaxID=2981135 RepID=A0ABY6EMB7_9ACTN|nr:hypothetical protein [Streptomyces sp. HUAS 14-6]UXY35538.1 hypothetical protein N8I86_12735 [Streptomyces sp. HUAS 14-6]